MVALGVKEGQNTRGESGKISPLKALLESFRSTAVTERECICDLFKSSKHIGGEESFGMIIFFP